jgi:hypothetical protein
VIGQTYPFGKGFLGLARYLEAGSSGEERDRVAWIESRNLPTTDPQTAARLMAATASLSLRTQRPVYHLSISFDPGDPVDRESMRYVADAVLRKLGLSGHEALIVAHKDTAHPNMHLVVNRVHPETRRAWENSWDWPKIEQALRAGEVELGFRIVPGRHGRVPGQQPARVLLRGDPAFLHRVAERAGPVLERARSWAEVHDGLAAVGLSVRVKGGGLVIHDDSHEVKASEVGFSRKTLEARFGKHSAHHFAQSRTVAGPSLAPASASAVPEPVREPEPEPEPVPAPQPEPVPLPVPPAAVRRQMEEAFAALVDEEADRLKEAGLRLKLQHAAEWFREAEAIRKTEKAVSEIVRAADAAAREVERLEALTRRATEATDVLQPALREVYAEPSKSKVAAHYRAKGLEDTVRILREKPEAFGKLRGVRPLWGLGLVRNTDEARRRARDLADLLETAARRVREKPTREALSAAQEHARKTLEAEVKAKEMRRALPHSSTAEETGIAVLRSVLAETRPTWAARELDRLLADHPEAAQRAARALQRALDAPRSIRRERGLGL